MYPDLPLTPRLRLIASQQLLYGVRGTEVDVYTDTSDRN